MGGRRSEVDDSRLPDRGSTASASGVSVMESQCSALKSLDTNDLGVIELGRKGLQVCDAIERAAFTGTFPGSATTTTTHQANRWAAA